MSRLRCSTVSRSLVRTCKTTPSSSLNKARKVRSSRRALAISANVASQERDENGEITVGPLTPGDYRLLREILAEAGIGRFGVKHAVNLGLDGEWFADEGLRVYGRLVPSRGKPELRQMVVKDPVGPVAAFTPWNFPINQVVRKVGPALAAGCSMIVKAAEETPAGPAAFVKAFADAGLPAGVLQLVYGNPAEVSGYLVPHPTIRKITFTGSTPVGKQLAALAGQHMKRVTMELGGHAPVILCEDADIALAVKAAGAAKFRNAGQACLAPTRFYVDRTIEGDFLDAFTAASHKLVLGDGMAPATQMGPLASARRLAAVRDLIDRSVQAGAQLHQGTAPTTGFFAPVSLLTHVNPESPVIQEEPFGPVVTLTPFDSIDHALHLANQSAYGLAGYLFTDSARAILKVSDQLEVGSLAINGMGVSVPEAPFGGLKDSGYGSESGIEGMEAFLDTKFTHHCA